MKKTRFANSQILAVLKQAKAGTPVPQLCREHGVEPVHKERRQTCAEIAPSTRKSSLLDGAS